MVGSTARPVAKPLQGDRPIRVRFFTDRYDWLGPAIVVLSSWYFAAQVLVGWRVSPPYNFFNNEISDLGNTTPCGQHTLCSPRWFVADASFVVLGLSMVLGAYLVFTEFSFSGLPRQRRVARLGFIALAAGGIGAAIVGFVPENHNAAHLHTVGTAMAIGLGQAAILTLGLVLRQIPDWLREFMLVTSLIVLLAGITIAIPHHPKFGFGDGALERLAQYPESVWLILFGFYISRDHFRKGKIGRKFKFAETDFAPSGSTMRWAFRESRRPTESIRPNEPEVEGIDSAESADQLE